MYFKQNKEDRFLDSLMESQRQMQSSDLKEFEEIVEMVSRYDVYDFISRVSSLNLLIENQNKSILLDALIAALLSRDSTKYSSSIKMSNGNFRKTISRLNNLSISMLVDPAENAFIERTSYYGNYWIFPGINFSPAYCLQGLINVLCLRDLGFPKEFVKKAHLLLNFILYFSNRAANILGYNIDTIQRCDSNNIYIPESDKIEKLISCIAIDYSVIERFIPDKELQACLFSDFIDADIQECLDINAQNFFKHPFILNGDKAILLNPTILVPFFIHQIMLLAESYNIRTILVKAYNNEIWNKCKISLSNLGHKRIAAEKYDIELFNNNAYKEEILSVGNDKLLFVYFICDPGDEYKDDSMFGSYELNEKIPKTNERETYFLEHLPETNRDNIYQLIVMNSFGRSIATSLSNEEVKNSISLSPFELYCISVNEREHEWFIPRYIDSKKKIDSLLPNLGISELNSIEIYTYHDYSFYLGDDVDLSNTKLYFPLGDSLDYVIRAIKKENRHLVASYDGVHLREIVLNDAVRNIYCTVDGIPELIIKFENVNIWITIELPKTEGEIDVYWSLIDTISYWLAECKSIINSFSFSSETLRIHILLDGSIEEYYEKLEYQGPFKEKIYFKTCNNKINIIWSPEAYQMLGEKTNRVEEEMVSSIIFELTKLCDLEPEVFDLKSIFTSPLKKKVFQIHLNNSPFLLPIRGTVPRILAEDEQLLLDEIGKHFLSQSQYTYGRVPDEKRAELANQVVGYLYSILQKEISSLKPDGIHEQVLLDLEKVMRQAMLTQYRYAYDITCYPEKSDQIFKQYNETNKVSIALKFLIEYIAAAPPAGKKPLGQMQYSRILAICSLIIDWAHKNDLFRYNIFNTPVEFLKSGRIGMPSSEGDYLTFVTSVAQTKKLENFSNPMVDSYSPLELIGDMLDNLDEAFFDEYEFTFKQFINCVLGITDYGNGISSEVKRASREDVIAEISRKEELPINIVEKIVDQISLTQRDDFLSPPKPFEPWDVYPWRFNRELSFTRRPLIQFNNDLIWGNRQVHHMWRFTIDLIIAGKYKARKPKLKEFMGKLSNKRGNHFNTLVAQKLGTIDGLIVHERVSKINGKKIAEPNGNVLGDIDVLYIIPEQYKIVVAEVKDYSMAKNPYEMDQEYKRIFVDGKKPCYLTKHKKRAAWIEEHIEDVIKHFCLSDGEWSVNIVIFVSEEIISNAFYHRGEKIIVYSQITEANVKNI